MTTATNTRSAIEAMGYDLTVEAAVGVRNLLMEDQARLLAAYPATAEDLAYGPHERHRLDVYAPAGGLTGAPVVVWVHGGGFTQGDKHPEGQPFNAHAGSFASANGFLGVVVNYRLAPGVMWPSGGEDLALVVAWLREHAAEHGGDPGKIVLVGTSAGAAHMGGYLHVAKGDELIRGAALLSGTYGFAPYEERDGAYFAAADHKLELQRAVVETNVPLFVAVAEFDPPRLQSESLSLLQAKLERDGHMPAGYIAMGHNHYSIGYHLGGPDSRLSDEVVAFVRSCTD